jgi:hypothetical protein
MRTLAMLVPAVLLAPLAARAQDPEKVTLAWRFAKGDVNRYEMKTEVNTTGADGGIEITQEFGFRWALEAKDVAADGTATLDVKYERVMMRMGGIGELEYDSDKGGEPDESDPAAALGRAMGAIVGKSITLKMTAAGRVLEVSGLDKLLDGLGDGAGAMAGMFDEAQLKHMMQTSFAFLPEKPVGPGDAWDHKFEYEMPMIGKMKQSGASKLKSLGDGGKSATFRTDVRLTAEGGEGGVVEVSDGTVETETVWSVADGRLESSSGTMKMKMSAAGQEFDVTAKTSMKRTTGKDTPTKPAEPKPPKREE